MIPFLASSDIDAVESMRDLWQERVVSRLRGKSWEEVRSIDDFHTARPTVWRDTIHGILRKPYVLLTGGGFQNYQWVSEKAIAGHNQYLHVLVELGVIGLVFYVQVLRAMWQQFGVLGRRDPYLYYLLSLPGTSCLGAILVVGLINESFYPARAVPGFMGFFLAYFAVATHRGWLGAGGKPGNTEPVPVRA
jgi:hypothetical protein